ncbi:MAG TPA: helix-turn-helix domain-containing protein [Candidatus Xenobia bacterium]|jgi:putative transcriptional regulator
MNKASAAKPVAATEPGLFDIVKEGLEHTIAYARGEKPLRVTHVVVNPPPEYSPAKVRAVRRKLNVSQAAFASILGVSVATVHSWEQGRQAPSRQACRMLQMVEKMSQRVLDLVVVRTSPKNRKVPATGGKGR